MFNPITARGIVATTPRFTHLDRDEDTAVLSFRLLSTVDTRDGEKHANWYTVILRDSMAFSVCESLKKGDRIVVSGELVMRELDFRHGTLSVEIYAHSIRHELVPV